MNISFTFYWVNLNQDDKKELVQGLDELIPFPMPPFNSIDRTFTQVGVEFVLYLEKGGVPALRLSDRTKMLIEALIKAQPN